MAFGTGSAVAHRAVDAVLGPQTIQHETVVSEAPAAATAPIGNIVGTDACTIHSKAFQDVRVLFSTSALIYLLHRSCLFNESITQHIVIISSAI